jgi:hypothetical protein
MTTINRACEAGLPEDERRQIVLLVQGETVEATARWVAWDWVRWGAPYLTIGLVLGAITDIAVRVLA